MQPGKVGGFERPDAARFARTGFLKPGYPVAVIDRDTGLVAPVIGTNIAAALSNLAVQVATVAPDTSGAIPDVIGTNTMASVRSNVLAQINSATNLQTMIPALVQFARYTLRRDAQREQIDALNAALKARKR